MLPNRNSANLTSGHASPRTTSGSVGGRRPLSLVTSQQPFRASTTQTLETESPQSEISPQETPPLPPRPAFFPPLPPGGSGLRRQSTRRTTYETYVSAIDEDDSVPLQPPNITSMPTPAPPHTPGPPPTPMRPRQPAPGGGAGGFTALPSPHHGSSRDYSHHNTAEYTYRFDTMPSPRSDSGPPHYESADISGGIHANVWPTYNKISQEFDEKRLAKWNTDLDVLLIFAALFSAIVTAFLIRALDDLEPNYQQQSALLLHQLLNGRDPSLTSASDPTIPFRPNGFAIAVNCLWFASLSASLGASFGAMICKEWLTEYNSGANPVVDLLRACQRQVRFIAFQRWNAHALVALLPPLLHSSVILFFTGAVVYLWQMDERVAIVYNVIGGIFGVTYFISTFLPFVTDIPFRPYSTLLFHRLSVAIGKVVIPIVDVFVHACYLILRYITSAILWPFAQIIVGDGPLHRWYMGAQTILPGEYKHIRVWWANAFNDSLDEIDTSQRVQEEAVLWLSQMPLDPSESKAVVSSLALISSSRPHKFPKSVTVFLNLTLESSFQEGPGREQTDIAIDCVLVLGHIKFQSVVDRNSDHDHNVGGIPVTASVAWAAQQLTINAFREKFSTPHSEGIRVRLLTAAAWLSPMDAAEDVHWDGGEKVKIQDRYQFIQEIRITLLRHVNKEKVLDNKVLINLIHGMHACIPRGNYGSASSIVSFLPLVCEDYDSPWSEDEAVLRALITYCLDLLLPPERRWPLVEREIEFDELASELIDMLVINVTSTDVVAFGFWLVYRVPYAFESRKTTLADIINIWDSAIEPIRDGARRQRLTFHAVDAFVAVAQYHVLPAGALPKFARQTALKLLNAALDSDHTRPMATYAIAMILNLGESSQVATVANGIKTGPFVETLFSASGDLESNTVEEDVVDLRIYSTLVLLKLRLRVELDVEQVREVIGRMEKTIGDPSVRDSGVARRSGADVSADLDRVRWKAIYLSALLLRFMPDDERERRAGGLRERVQGLVRSGELPFVDDNQSCLKPLDMDELELRTPAAEQEGPITDAFEVWVFGFPLFPLAGSVALVGN